MVDMTKQKSGSRIVYSKDSAAEYSVDIVQMTAVWTTVSKSKQEIYNQVTKWLY